MTGSSQQDNLPLAVVVIVLTVLTLSLSDALIKFASADLVLWQIFVLRSALALPVLLVWLFLTNRSAFTRPSNLGWITLRSLMMVAMWVTYYLALPRLDLSVAAATYYTAPLFITLFSALFTGDPIGRNGWIAVVIGFAGVLLIVRPSAGDFNWFAILPLISAILYALAMILTRVKCREEHPMMLAAALNLGFLLTGLVATLVIPAVAPSRREGFILGPWADLAGPDWMAITLLATAILFASIGAAIAYQKGPPAIIGTFDFAYVGFAVLWGMVIFAETPDLPSWTGIGLIVMAGVLSLRK